VQPAAAKSVCEHQTRPSRAARGSATRDRVSGDSQAYEYAFTQTAFKVCPFCGTYYQYRYDRDDGEHFMDPTNEDVHLVRCSPTWVRVELLQKNTPAAQDLLDALERRYLDLIRDYVARLAPHPPQNWQISKHLIETLTDEYLLKRDWEGLEILLLRHAHPVVRIETAADLLYIATEKYPVWDIRDFTPELAQAAQHWLFHDNHAQFLVDVFVTVLHAPLEETLAYDWFFGYRHTQLSVQALSGLSNVAYRQIDITRAVPALVHLFSQNEWLNTKIRWPLIRLIEHQSAPAKALIRHEIKCAGIDPTLPAIQDVLKARKQRKHK
jgi:hypothetical protein